METEGNTSNVTEDVAKFISNQTEMNNTIGQFMESYARDKATRDQQQSDTIKLLQTLMQKTANEPPAKKTRVDPDEATSGSHRGTPDEAISGSTVSGGKQKVATSAVAIMGTGETSSDMVEIDVGTANSLIDEELALLNQLNDPDGNKENEETLTEEEPPEANLNEMTEEQVEDYLCREYSDWLSQTEEKVGPPVSQVLGVLCERLWGKLLLSQEKKKEMQDGINIPSNCRSFKAPKLNPEIHIRIYENARKKDDAAKTRQVNMARAAIPLLYTLGELDASKQRLENQLKFLREPRDLEEAKKIIAVAKKQNEAALASTKTAKSKVSKSFQLLNYNCTETTRKRRQDICGELGSALKPFGLETTAPKEHLFDEDAMKRMKSELKAIKPKVEKPKNVPSSTQSRRSGNHTQGKNNNYHKNPSSNSSGNYNNNNSGQHNSGNNANTKKYPQRNGRRGR